MAQQISKGTSYDGTPTGSQVTYQNLNAHVDNASLLIGAVTEQTTTSVSASTDEIIIAKVGATSLNKQTKADFTKSLTSNTIDANAGNDVTITPYNGAIVTGSNYVSGNGLLNTVTTSVAHGLTAGQIVLISSASNYFYNGYYTIKTAPTSTTFTYELNMSDMYSGTGSFSSLNGTLVTVTTGTAHNFSNNQPLNITANNVFYSGTFNITVTGANTFTYTLTVSTTAGTGTISYITTSAIAGNGTLSYLKLATLKVNGSNSITGALSIAGTSEFVGDAYVKGTQINDGSVIQNGSVVQNGTVNVTGAIQYNGTPVYGLYEVIDYPVSLVKTAPAYLTPEFTKPANEIWEVEFYGPLQFYYGGSGNFTYINITNKTYTTTYTSTFMAATVSAQVTPIFLKFFVGSSTVLTNEKFAVTFAQNNNSNGNELMHFMIKKYKTA